MSLRFNPPPNWPPPPPGWTPPPGWRPDPAWPPPPLGWRLWVEAPIGERFARVLGRIYLGPAHTPTVRKAVRAGLLSFVTFWLLVGLVVSGDDPAQLTATTTESTAPTPTTAERTPTATATASQPSTPTPTATQTPTEPATPTLVATQKAVPTQQPKPKPKPQPKPKPDPEPEPTRDPEPEPEPVPDTDPQFGTCKEAIAHGYGPYRRGTHPEYYWYDDRDDDGVVCER